jgi:hypothetical protein
MFDLADKRLAWMPVKWPGFVSRGDEPGEVVDYEAVFQVELVDIDRFQFLFMNPINDDGEKHAWATDEAFEAWKKGEVDDKFRGRELVNNWRGIASGGTSVAYTPDNMNRLMGKPNFAVAFFTEYTKAYRAIKETRSGNSDASPETGSTGEASAE